MSGLRDPQIKLFGKTIELPDTSGSGVAIGSVSVRCGEPETEEHSSLKEPPSSSDSMLEDCNLTAAKDQESNKSLSDLKEAETKHEEDDVQHLSSNDSKDPNTSKTEEDDQNETSNSQDKTLKKPDKILPCPRCNSVDTKFCYFNNYNVNQPRHFCKNCQRYWTAGGSMRNVPVGAGRRKNKSSYSSSSSVLSQFRHLAVPEALNHNGTILAFGSDVPLCESMASVLNIADKTAKHGSRNGFHKPEGLVISVPGTDNGAQYSSGSSGKATGLNDDMGQPGLTHTAQNCHPFPTQVPCYPGASWPYPWNPVQWNSLVSQGAFRPGNFPIPYYSTPPPPPYWGCSLPGAWNVPWMISPTSAQSHFQSPSSCSGPNSPTLGKHSRDDSCLKPDSSAKEDESVKERNDSEEKSLWVPKTLRIDDPEEAAKSSIWATLGIKNDRASDSINSNGLFKGFQGRQQTKGDEKTRVCESSTVLQANPAALSRSLRFHENS